MLIITPPIIRQGVIIGGYLFIIYYKMCNINSLYIRICIELDNLKPLYKNLMNKKEKTPEERITQLDTIWIIEQLENFIKILDNSDTFRELYNSYRKIALKFYHLFN